jgi:hypothetical protein
MRFVWPSGLVAFAIGLGGFALAQSPLTDQQIAAAIVKASRDAYYQTGRPCACPEDLARNGSRLRQRHRSTCAAGEGGPPLLDVIA